MDIKTQNAENIYNINGGMHLHNSPEVVELLNKKKQADLNELYSISFFDILSKEYSERKLIEREDEIFKIQNRLEETHQLILYGDPGLGKTTTLFQLSKKLNSVIYISAKNKTPIAIVSYLINKIRLANGDELLEIKDIDEGIIWLQSCLQKSKQCFIVDDCEQDIDTTKKIIALEKIETTFLFATRSNAPFESTGVVSYPCNPFTEEDVSLYLQSQGLNFSKLVYNNIFIASSGNPLYLFYFSQFQISPLPDSLVEFQNSIWTGLTTSQQEIVALISISYFKITIQEIAELLNRQSLLEFSKEVNELSAIIKNYNGLLELFHPSFNEFVLDKLRSIGLLDNYQEKLGDYYLVKEDIVQATYLLVDIAPNKIEKYIYDVFPSLINWGELNFAIKVLKVKLKTVEKDLDKGYLYYHLCHLHHLLGNREDATFCIDKSLEYLKKAKHKEFYAAALMFKAMNLIEQGNVIEATKIADKVIENIKEDKKEFKAQLLVNLSKIYVDLTEYEKGAKACKEAFEIFEEMDFKDGMIESLVNLVTCLSQIDEYRVDAEKYGLRLLEIIKQTSKFTIEVIVLNTLASIYREKKEYPQAKIFSNEAIRLCQKYEMKDKAVLNLINFGNILRDEGDINGAKEIYNEALIKTKEYNLKREEGRIYWILASIYRKEENFEISIEYSDKSISNSTSINFYYGIANALDEKSKTLLLMNEPIKAAEALVSSAEFYNKIEHHSNLYQYKISKAIEIYRKEGNNYKANELINLLIFDAEKHIDYGDVIDLILEDSSDETIQANFENLFNKYFSNENNDLNIFNQFRAFINYCKSIKNEKGRLLFKKELENIIDNLGTAKYSFSLLGFAIEQSEFLLNSNDIDELSKRLQDKLPMFLVREIEDKIIILSSIADKINLEIHSFNDELICNKLVIALILVLHEIPNAIISDDPLLEKKCSIWFQLYSDEMKKNIGEDVVSKIHFDKNVQSLHFSKADAGIPDMILINPQYEILSNLSTHQNNKVSLYFFVSAIMGIKDHFYHSFDHSYNHWSYILPKVSKLFDYVNPNIDVKPNKSKFEINIDKIIPPNS